VENSLTDSASPTSEASNALLLIRGAIGGTLMGLANLVPGISGGTMLLAAGVYPGFIAAIAEATTLRFKFRSLLLLGTIVVSAALSILLLAGTVKELVVEHRWIMYSLFIGLTLGGIPLVWRMARPMNRSLLVSALVCFGLMVVMALSGAGVSGDSGRNYPLIFLAGLAASSAMILPGVSGGYLLLLLGQYESILGTVDQLKAGLLGNGNGAAPDLALVLDAMHVVIPLGIGIVVGVVGVSNLLQWLLQRYEKATLGALLGLLFGAVVGLWPYQQAHPPQTGDVIKGQVVTLENVESFDADDWPVRFFEPSAGQAASSLALVGLGLAGTLLIGRLGNSNGND
jgi:putative membrane protein